MRTGCWRQMAVAVPDGGRGRQLGRTATVALLLCTSVRGVPSHFDGGKVHLRACETVQHGTPTGAGP